MSQTSTSLLARLSDPATPEAWQQLVDLYVPLIHRWLQRHGIQLEDRNDLAQEVLTVVHNKLPTFEHNQRTGAFRNWLRSITVNCLRKHWRAIQGKPRGQGGSDLQEVLAELEDPHSALSHEWNQEHDTYVTRKLLELIKPRFQEKTWKAFEQFALDEIPATEVAESLGITVNAVFVAKSRVLAQLRVEAQGLLEEE